MHYFRKKINITESTGAGAFSGRVYTYLHYDYKQEPIYVSVYIYQLFHEPNPTSDTNFSRIRQ
jgi:hypothetical protein